MKQFSSTAFFCFEDISALKQFSSNTNPRQLDFFEEISCIAEKTSKPVPHGLASKIRIEENCMWQEISSTKKERKFANSRKTASIRNSPRLHLLFTDDGEAISIMSIMKNVSYKEFFMITVFL